MINPFNEITTYEGDSFDEYLKRLYLFDVFKEIFSEYPDKNTCIGVVRFIAYGYSLDSNMLMTAGNTWGKVAPLIFKKVGLPDELYNDTVLLENAAVHNSIQRFLRLQDNENWNQYILFRDLRTQFMSYSLSKLKKSTGEIDIQAKMDAATYSRDLLKMMEDARMSFISNNQKLKGSVDALNKAMKQKDTISPEKYAK